MNTRIKLRAAVIIDAW